MFDGLLQLLAPPVTLFLENKIKFKLLISFQAVFNFKLDHMPCSCVCLGHKTIVEELLSAGALVDARMGVPATTTPVDLAKDFEQHDILSILQCSANVSH